MNVVASSPAPAARAGDPDAALLATVETLRPLIAEHRSALAVGPDLPEPVAEALVDAGLTQLWLPRGLGGPETHPLRVLAAIEALAELDGSVAWCAAISSGGASRFADLIDRDAMRALMPAGKKFAGSGSGQPTGTAVRDGAGWRINGRWSWASFCRFSSVSALMCLEIEGGQPKLDAHGRPSVRGVFMASRDVEVVGNWNAGGLRSSGSHDVVCTDIWVPDARTVDGARIMMPHDREPLYMLPMASAAAIAAAGVPLGLARASIDALIDLAQTKTPHGGKVPLRLREDVQVAVARAETSLGAARAFARDTVSGLWSEAENGRPVTPAWQAKIRQACWYAGHVGKQVVTSMYEAAGSSAVLEALPFARQLRDVYATCQHMQYQDRMLVPPGRILLSLEADAPFI
ncbi:acyl-CoA dehydrogenase family protein [Methylobacterium radiotolerans]|uniref:acyl-CoA dehydrogenase family protein n=1 Tax=Methylobacterium radiotolerans TaxID=31998 RepID=UPI0015F62476|nr:acyl-CoA dehydrogenase family protein [Methylobacterium radiotolerans]